MLATPVVGRLLRWGPVERKVALLNRSAVLERGRARFVLRELSGSRNLGRYRVRGVRWPLLVRHGTADLATLDDVFLTADYEPPPLVRRCLEALSGPPRVLDLGANVGYFGAFLLARFPGARIVALEPDPDNVAILRRAIAESGQESRWRVEEAAAGTREGSVEFVAGLQSTSHVAAPGETDATMPVRSMDVLPLLQDADLIKVDIEGAEWELLADDRFTAAAPALVLEYHAERCPDPDPEQLARRLLTGAGYQVQTTIRRPGGQGVMWAWRGDSGESAG
jgi:FkbM family methyltransferase